MRAFTLVELMIVIVIIGVLSVLAITGYRRYTLAARNSEAVQFLGAIRAAQEAYFQAWGQYCGAAQPAKHPAAMAFTKPLRWDDPNANTPAAWQDLGIRSPGSVWFQYSLRAGGPNNVPSPPLPQGWDKPWYVVSAHSDFDQDNKISTFEVTPAKPDVFIKGETE